MLKSKLSPDEINQYFNNRNFIRTISAIGQYNILILCIELLKPSSATNTTPRN